MRRTAVINQIRGLLLEHGITLRKGRCHVDAASPGILEDADAKLSGAMRVRLARLKLELDHLERRIDQTDAVIKKAAGENKAFVCSRLWTFQTANPPDYCAFAPTWSVLTNFRFIPTRFNHPTRTHPESSHVHVAA
jgi:hypothetical protein